MLTKDQQITSLQAGGRTNFRVIYITILGVTALINQQGLLIRGWHLKKM